VKPDAGNERSGVKKENSGVARQKGYPWERTTLRDTTGRTGGQDRQALDETSDHAFRG